LKTYKEIKDFCDKEIEKYPSYKERYKKEISYLKRFFNAKRDIIEEFKQNKEKIDKRYVLPFLLGFTEEVSLEKPLDMVQVKPGASGGRNKIYATLNGDIV